MNNYEQMREALVYARTVLANWSRYTPFRAWNEIGEAIDKCDAALSAPPRNCNIGTVEEQFKRYHKFCMGGHGCSTCKVGIRSGAGCSLAWAQMPYKAEGAEK